MTSSHKAFRLFAAGCLALGCSFGALAQDAEPQTPPTPETPPPVATRDRPPTDVHYTDLRDVKQKLKLKAVTDLMTRAPKRE